MLTRICATVTDRSRGVVEVWECGGLQHTLAAIEDGVPSACEMTRLGNSGMLRGPAGTTIVPSARNVLTATSPWGRTGMLAGLEEHFISMASPALCRHGPATPPPTFTCHWFTSAGFDDAAQPALRTARHTMSVVASTVPGMQVKDVSGAWCDVAMRNDEFAVVWGRRTPRAVEWRVRPNGAHARGCMVIASVDVDRA